MGVQTVTIKTCDRCGERIHDLSREHTDAGELTVTWNGSRSAIGCDGAAGGANLKGSKLLCKVCMEGFFDFLNPPAAGVDLPDGGKNDGR